MVTLSYSNENTRLSDPMKVVLTDRSDRSMYEPTSNVMSSGYGQQDQGYGRTSDQGQPGSPSSSSSQQGQGAPQQHPSPSHQRLAPPSRAPPRRVDHTYRDYSNFPISELPVTKKTPTNFPSKLHQILSTAEFAHIISWMPHGRAWKIHNKELLVREVIPKYFVQSKYESFTRQLNGWGFKRLHQSGNDFNAYYHEAFLRGLPHLTVLLKRVPPNQGKLLPHVEGEPNFYEIDKQFPLPSPTMPYPPAYAPHPHYAPAPAPQPYGYGPPPEAAGYPSPRNYSSYQSGYHHPPPPPYYGHPPPPSSEQGAHVPGQPAPGAPGGYPSQQPGYMPYPYWPPPQGHHSSPHHHPPPQDAHATAAYPPHYPYPPGPYAPPPPSHHYGDPHHQTPGTPTNGGPVKSEQLSPPAAPLENEYENVRGGSNEEELPLKGRGQQEDSSLEPLNIFTESENTTASSP